MRCCSMLRRGRKSIGGASVMAPSRRLRVHRFPKALDQSKVALAQWIHTSGESASTIAAELGVSLRPFTESWPRTSTTSYATESLVSTAYGGPRNRRTI